MVNNRRTAIVIGASSGIGQEVARLLIADGWTVGVAARREEMLQTLKSEARNGQQVETARIDVTSEDAPERLHELIRQLGGMNLFFYAPAIGKVNRQLQTDIELTTMETNVTGFTRMIGAAYHYFVEVGGGHIAAISSIAGTMGLGPAPAYSASKALQATYLQALEQLIHQQKQSIHITDIRPGFVDTALLTGQHYPMMLRPEKVAKEIVWAINHKKHVRIVDWRYRLLTLFWCCVPKWLWRRLPL